MQRRTFLTVTMGGLGLSLLVPPVHAQHGGHTQPSRCPSDGTPLQFIPKQPADPMPAENDLAKFPTCPYCGMDRKASHHARMLVHYSDDLPDATDSLHCAAISLAVNLDRAPKAIYVADNARAADSQPLIRVEQAIFLVGSTHPGVMTRRSKLAYGTEAAGRAAQAASGGELMDFDQALLAAYADMVQDVAMIRKNREERSKQGA